jgi:hypothetical protein
MLFPYRLSLAAPLLCAGLSASLLASLAQSASAQSPLPACPPPAAQEFLLLVRGETEAERSKIATILPPDNPVLVCQYLDETVVRAGGFTSLETANAWASYMMTVEGFDSFVSRPAGPESVQTAATSQPQPTDSQMTAAVSNGTAFQPRRLEPGYAVLVRYGAQPEIATTVGQVVRPVGLAVYAQEAYLLADYTSDADSAAATLQRLTNAQLSAILVDAHEVVRLSAEVIR